MDFSKETKQHLDQYELFKAKGVFGEESNNLIEAKANYITAVEHLIMAAQLEKDQKKKKLYEEKAKIIVSYTEEIKKKIENKNKPKLKPKPSKVLENNDLKKEKKMDRKLYQIRENAFVSSKVLGKSMNKTKKQQKKSKKESKKKHKKQKKPDVQISEDYTIPLPQLNTDSRNINYPYQQQMFFNQINQGPLNNNHIFNNQMYYQQPQNFNFPQNNMNQSAQVPYQNGSGLNNNHSTQN
ncbi:hypothetical protein M0813_17893 [Anaeramoeba flamelloides]|uniref:Uncharacterized protein n=1 Tax=Anaeramoeba flamelloides TaxID=1746091 RepID=A0ABQ8YUN3_9EUKA|nr:hypothetical protein M0813_17893 [Anaeramoeba flamelloides]